MIEKSPMFHLNNCITSSGRKKILKSILLLSCLTDIWNLLGLHCMATQMIEKVKIDAIYKTVEFISEGAILRGRLYTPNVKTKLPVIIMAHGYSATVEGMVADHYAEVFYEAGFAVLLYDHRNLGKSDGEPRQELNRWTQARGTRASRHTTPPRRGFESSPHRCRRKTACETVRRNPELTFQPTAPTLQA